MPKALELNGGGLDERADLGYRELPGEGHAGNAEVGEGRDCRSIVRVHLGRSVKPNVWHRLPDRREDPEVLHDDCIDARRPRVVYDLERVSHLAFEHEDVESEIDANARDVGEADVLGEGIEREVLGASPSVEAIDAEIDSVGAVVHRSPKRGRSPRGSE